MRGRAICSPVDHFDRCDVEDAIPTNPDVIHGDDGMRLVAALLAVTTY